MWKSCKDGNLRNKDFGSLIWYFGMWYSLFDYFCYTGWHPTYHKQTVYRKWSFCFFFFCWFELQPLNFFSFIFKVTTTVPQSLQQSPTWCSLTWWIRCCLTRISAARFPGSVPPQSVRWIGRIAPYLKRRTMMRDPRWSMDCLVS